MFGYYAKNKYLKLTHVSERQLRLVLNHFCLDISANKTAVLIGLNRNTVNRLHNLLRIRVVQLGLTEQEQFTGEVEIDESYFGARRVRGKRGRSASGKIPVIGLLKRQGMRIYQGCEKLFQKGLIPIIKGKVLTESKVYTDGWKSYDGLVVHGYDHKRIHHYENEFARGKNHVNGIESFWSFAKKDC